MAKRIGEQLLCKGIITNDQLVIALTEQRTASPNERLGKIIVRMGFTSESVIRDVLSENLGEDSVDLSQVIPTADALAMISVELAREHSVIPLAVSKQPYSITLAMADTYNLRSMDKIQSYIGDGIKIITQLAGESEINNAIDQYYGYELSVDGILHEIETGEADDKLSATEHEEYKQPFVRLVDAILVDAVKRDVSDIHFEPEFGFLRLRYRIDGVLRQVRALHKDFWSAIAVRLKVISQMNIAESRAPQDGHFSLRIAGRHIDFRAACLPTAYGENIVLRILDRQRGIVSLDELGLSDHNFQKLKKMMTKPSGLIIATGPTGSGKTTTLYSLLNGLSSERVNIMTLEDPVEYPMDMVRQTSVNSAVKLDYATGIRAIMRQDPDIILVGEIRDEDTAQMAFRAAMTGHQVFTTLHANSAIGAIPRLLDIGILPSILAGNIIGIISQRLVRKLCKHCKQIYIADEMECSMFNEDAKEPIQLYRAKGCAQCEGTGYRGRTSIMEVLCIDSYVEAVFTNKMVLNEIQTLARDQGFMSLLEDGLRLVKQGETSLEEVSRVIDMSSSKSTNY